MLFCFQETQPADQGVWYGKEPRRAGWRSFLDKRGRWNAVSQIIEESQIEFGIDGTEVNLVTGNPFYPVDMCVGFATTGLTNLISVSS